jgi:hypothetical protein
MPARKRRWGGVECTATLAAETRQSAASDSECIRDSAVAIACPLRASCSFQRVVGNLPPMRRWILLVCYAADRRGLGGRHGLRHNQMSRQIRWCRDRPCPRNNR